MYSVCIVCVTSSSSPLQDASCSSVQKPYIGGIIGGFNRCVSYRDIEGVGLMCVWYKGRGFNRSPLQDASCSSVQNPYSHIHPGKKAKKEKHKS
jgi:hypothetical protein